MKDNLKTLLILILITLTIIPLLIGIFIATIFNQHNGMYYLTVITIAGLIWLLLLGFYYY